MRFTYLLVVSCTFVAIGCGGDRAARRSVQDAAVPRQNSGPTTKIAYDFYDNRVHADVVVDGTLLVDCGDVEFARYIEGGYRSSWHLHREVDGQRAALVDGVAGELYLPLDGDAGAVARAEDGSVWLSMYIRGARRGQLVSVFLNEQKLGDIPMGPATWQLKTIRAPAQFVREGENKLRLYFRHGGELAGKRSAAAIGMIALGAKPLSSVPEPQLKAGSVRHAKQSHRALQLRSAGRLSYHIAVPDMNVRLQFAVAGERAQASVQIATEGAAEATLWSGAVRRDAWAEVDVDLSGYAGSVIRLSLISGGGVDWGRLQLVSVTRRRDRLKPQHSNIQHVIVWVISSLRADRFAQGKVPTPSFSRFVRGGVWFRNARSVAPAPGPAHVAILTGRYPQGASIPKQAVTLAERFRDSGYHTALISGNGFVNDEAGFARGFQIYKNPMRRRHPFKAQYLWQAARQVLARHRDGKTFLYIVTVEPHLPYTPSDRSVQAEWGQGEVNLRPSDTLQLSRLTSGNAQQYSEKQRSFVQALYNAEVRDSDAAFGNMIEDLNKLQVDDRTAVFLVADHGEELWERGGVGHGKHLFEEVQRVPLAMRIPRTSVQKRVDRAVELIDLYPTILSVADIEVARQVHGEDLMPLATGVSRQPSGPIFSHIPGVGRSVIVGRFKFILPLRGQRGLYDLLSDAGETINLMGRKAIVERYLRNVFGIAVAHEQSWNERRWGRADNVSSVFASDHGL